MYEDYLESLKSLNSTDGSMLSTPQPYVEDLHTHSKKIQMVIIEETTKK